VITAGLDREFLNGVRLFVGQGANFVGCEVKINGRLHEESTAALAALDWPRTEEPSGASTFLLLVHPADMPATSSVRAPRWRRIPSRRQLAIFFAAVQRLFAKRQFRHVLALEPLALGSGRGRGTCGCTGQAHGRRPVSDRESP
jgi:hypothetical protein